MTRNLNLNADASQQQRIDVVRAVSHTNDGEEIKKKRKEKFVLQQCTSTTRLSRSESSASDSDYEKLARFWMAWFLTRRQISCLSRASLVNANRIVNRQSRILSFALQPPSGELQFPRRGYRAKCHTRYFNVTTQVKIRKECSRGDDTHRVERVHLHAERRIEHRGGWVRGVTLRGFPLPRTPPDSVVASHGKPLLHLNVYLPRSAYTRPPFRYTLLQVIK